MNVSRKLLNAAQKHADRLGHAILIGLPKSADLRQSAQLFDTGGLRSSYQKWEENYEIAEVIWPSSHRLGGGL